MSFILHIFALICSHGSVKSKFEELDKAQREESDEKIGYSYILIPGGGQFHLNIVTIIG